MHNRYLLYGESMRKHWLMLVMIVASGLVLIAIAVGAVVLAQGLGN